MLLPPVDVADAALFPAITIYIRLVIGHAVNVDTVMQFISFVHAYVHMVVHCRLRISQMCYIYEHHQHLNSLASALRYISSCHIHSHIFVRKILQTRSFTGELWVCHNDDTDCNRKRRKTGVYSFTLRRSASSSMSIASLTFGLLSVAEDVELELDGAVRRFFILHTSLGAENNVSS